ncbi:MAG: hypothetical protein AAF799_06410 [Myxococcota bacterium]
MMTTTACVVIDGGDDDGAAATEAAPTTTSTPSPSSDGGDTEITGSPTPEDSTADEGTSADTSGGQTDGVDSGSSTTGIECTRFLEGEIEGCRCHAFGGQGAGPFYCGADLLCDATTGTCTSSTACETVEADPEPNDGPDTATDFGMVCNSLPWQGQLEPGGSDWFTWRGFHPTAGCGDPGGVQTYDPNIEVCFYHACIDGQGDLGELSCGGTSVTLPDGTPGCCSPSAQGDSLTAYACDQGVEVWVELRNTTEMCIGYEAQLNLV